jgi:hypothetical protein
MDDLNTLILGHSDHKNGCFGKKRAFLPPSEPRWNQFTSHDARSYRMQKWSLLSRYARNHLSKKANGKIAQFFANGLLHRHPLLVFGALVLLLTLLLPAPSPEWDRHVITFLRARPLFLGAVGIGLLYMLLWKVPKWQVADIDNEKDRVTTESAFRQTLVQILGGAVLLGGLYYTAQTLRVSQQTLQLSQQGLHISQEGQITDRFTKAIEQLGKNGDEHLALRLGGIYALERIAKDSAEKDHGTVMEILTAFVRKHAPLKEQLKEEASRAGEVKGNQQHPAPPTDIQAILTVLGRRTKTDGKEESLTLDLRRTNLQGAFLWQADLQGAHLTKAKLQGANLWQTNLQGAFLWQADLQGANLEDANLQGANLSEANLQGVRGLIPEQVNHACADGPLRLPAGFTPPPPCTK